MYGVFLLICSEKHEQFIIGFLDLLDFQDLNTAQQHVASCRVCRCSWPDEEGFHELAEQFRGVAAIEKFYEERCRALLKNVETKAVFEKSGMVMWECRNCGHLVISTVAPDACPVQASPGIL